ncbi:hypothetical protein EYF80_040758 [Liparis tanakae]|uniref:Uncharacterized protein n=1 Tax=Liparis tanakae TaxID=230148 RepID=A0A4Z2G7E6_9TELE|nr:hypothetical protein EYF80_040758 [Liparis tanakae]
MEPQRHPPAQRAADRTPTQPEIRHFILHDARFYIGGSGSIPRRLPCRDHLQILGWFPASRLQLLFNQRQEEVVQGALDVSERFIWRCRGRKMR